MATTKKTSGPARGAALVKKAIDASAIRLTAPEPVPASVLKKLRLPNDERLPAGLKAFLAHDVSTLGWSIDDEEPELEPMSLDELVAQEFGDELVSTFGEACELLDGDCVLIEDDADARSFLYVGEPDDAGEYPVITLHEEKATVSGFIPFDVWIAQRFGALPVGDGHGWVPDEYVATVQALAESNGDGRRTFCSEHRDIEKDDDDGDDHDEDGEAQHQ